MLNGNSTSNLLLDYKSENPQAYWSMMQYLFGGDYPLFSNIKMEMGNDGNNSTGAEACTKRYEDEEADASRSPGFVMAADAKKINPNVKVSILRWEYPNWVKAKADGTEKYAAIYNGIRKPSSTPTRSTAMSSTTSIPIRTRPVAPTAGSSSTSPTRWRTRPTSPAISPRKRRRPTTTLKSSPLTRTRA